MDVPLSILPLRIHQILCLHCEQQCCSRTEGTMKLVTIDISRVSTSLYWSEWVGHGNFTTSLPQNSKKSDGGIRLNITLKKVTLFFASTARARNKRGKIQVSVRKRVTFFSRAINNYFWAVIKLTKSNCSETQVVAFGRVRLDQENIAKYKDQRRAEWSRVSWTSPSPFPFTLMQCRNVLFEKRDLNNMQKCWQHQTCLLRQTYLKETAFSLWRRTQRQMFFYVNWRLFSVFTPLSAIWQGKKCFNDSSKQPLPRQSPLPTQQIQKWCQVSENKWEMARMARKFCRGGGGGRYRAWYLRYHSYKEPTTMPMATAMASMTSAAMLGPSPGEGI